MDVRSLLRVFKWMGYVALGLAALLAVGLVTLVFFVWSLT